MYPVPVKKRNCNIREVSRNRKAPSHETAKSWGKHAVNLRTDTAPAAEIGGLCPLQPCSASRGLSHSLVCLFLPPWPLLDSPAILHYKCPGERMLLLQMVSAAGTECHIRAAVHSIDSYSGRSPPTPHPVSSVTVWTGVAICPGWSNTVPTCTCIPGTMDGTPSVLKCLVCVTVYMVALCRIMLNQRMRFPG